MFNIQKPSRGWIFTINNPTITRQDFIDILTTAYQKTLIYAVVCKEKGESGTEHLQAYAEFKQPIQLLHLKNHFKDNPHLEPRRGTPKQATDYVKHQGDHEDKKGDVIEDFIEFGECPIHEQGKRSDLADISQMIQSGVKPSELRSQYPSQYLLHSNKFWSLYYELQAEKYQIEHRDVKVIYIWGPTGVGKSYDVHKFYSPEDMYRVSNYANPWDGYKGQGVIVLEEFRSGIQLGEFLTLTEGYPQYLKARFNDKVACHHTVVIITNVAYDEQYTMVRGEHPKSWEAYERRLQYVVPAVKYNNVLNALKEIEANGDNSYYRMKEVKTSYGIKRLQNAEIEMLSIANKKKGES